MKSSEASTEFTPIEPDPLIYMLSSQSGFGHASRAVAVMTELDQSIGTTVAANEKVYDFMTQNLPGRDARFSPLNYSHNPTMTLEGFLADNPHLQQIMLDSKIVVADFPVQSRFLRDILGGASKTQNTVGIYHSFYGYDSEDESIIQFQKKYRDVAGVFDKIFLVEPRVFHRDPWFMETGTEVIPCDPVVRQPTVSPDKIKSQLGLREGEEFIYLQGGMHNGNSLDQTIRSASELSLSGLKLVVAGAPGTTARPYVVDDGDVVRIEKRMDGHNVIAASQGVISKPGMQVVSEAVAFRKPVLLTEDSDAERKIKFLMLKELLGEDLPYVLDSQAAAPPQVSRWIECSREIIKRFAEVPSNGAVQIASQLQ